MKTKNEIIYSTPIIMTKSPEPERLEGIDLLGVIKEKTQDMPPKSCCKTEFKCEHYEINLKYRKCANGNDYAKAVVAVDNGETRNTQIITEVKKDNIVRRTTEEVSLKKDLASKEALKELKGLTNKEKGSAIGKSERTISRWKNR